MKSLTVQCSGIKLEDKLIEHVFGSRTEEECTLRTNL